MGVSDATQAFLFWGLMIALQPPFYPSEAEKKGAKPTEVRIFGPNFWFAKKSDYFCYFSMDQYLEPFI